MDLSRIENFKDAVVTVMGLGIYKQGSGLGTAKWLMRHGAQTVITDFRFANGSAAFQLTISMNFSDPTNGAKSFSGLSTDGQGRPTSGMVQIGVGPDSRGGGYFLDPTPASAEEFRGTLLNPYARDATAGGPASGLADLYAIVLHEVTHTLGLGSTPHLAFQQNSRGYLRNK
jgi:hypothetical protein